MSRSRLGRRRRAIHLAVAVVPLLATLAAPMSAFGHAALETITPADKSSGPSPTEIVGTFAQNLDPAKSSFTLVNAAGTVVAKGGEVGGDPRQMTLAVTSPLGAGAYTIRWTTVSTEDGETARGTTTFTVVAASPSPSPTPPASAGASAAPSASPSPTATVTPSPSASAGPTTPASSTSDAVIPIVAALIVLAAVGAWLLRGRGRGTR